MRSPVRAIVLLDRLSTTSDALDHEEYTHGTMQFRLSRLDRDVADFRATVVSLSSL